MRSGFRLRTASNNLYADIYLYDSLSSGAGYADRTSSYIEDIFDKMKDILSDCNCNKSCPNCLQHFGNQKNKENLDRFLGLDFLEFVRFGRLRTKVNKVEEEEYVDKLNYIAKLHGIDNAIIENSGKYYINRKKKKKRIIILSINV